jgi:hypothetical protein
MLPKINNRALIFPRYKTSKTGNLISYRTIWLGRLKERYAVPVISGAATRGWGCHKSRH